MATIVTSINRHFLSWWHVTNQVPLGDGLVRRYDRLGYSQPSVERYGIRLSVAYAPGDACHTYVPLDPFFDVSRVEGGQSGLIHIRIQQRNGRKTLTTVQGISDDYDKKKLVKAFKKVTILLDIL